MQVLLNFVAMISMCLRLDMSYLGNSYRISNEFMSIVDMILDTQIV